MVIQSTTSPHDPRALIGEPLIRCSSFGQVIRVLKLHVELSPTREKLKEKVTFITCDEYIGLASSEYRMLICTITLSIMIYMYMCHIAPRRRSHGSAWLCHVALRGMSPPRESRAKIYPLLFFFNCFKQFKLKINSEKSEKSP